MGGLENKGTTFPQFVGTHGGFFTQRMKDEDKDLPGVESRQLERGPNAGAWVHERKFDTLSGRLVSITTEDSDYGKKWKFVLDYQGKEFQLSFGYTSRNAEEILYRLPNITDLSKDIELKIFWQPEQYIERNGQQVKQNARNVIWMRQFDSKISMKPKDEWESLPDLQKVLIQGKETYDSSLRMGYMENFVTQNITPVLEGFMDQDDIEPGVIDGTDPQEAPVMPQHELYEDQPPVEPQQPPVPTAPPPQIDEDEKLPF